MFALLRRNRWAAFLAAPVLALAMGLASGQTAYAHGGHGGFGGGHFGGFGGHFGGFGGGHFGGFGGHHFGGFGGRIGGFRGYGGFHRGLYGYGLGYGLGGSGWGYPYYGYGLGSYGWGYPYYGYGLGGYGWGYPYYGYGYSYPYYGYAYNYPNYGYGYTFPYSGNLTSYVAPVAAAPSASQTASATQPLALGIEAQPVLEANGQEAMRVSRVVPGTAADKAGLKAGDTIESANGYMTQDPRNMLWIINNAAPGNVLKMTVRTAKDGLDHTVTAMLRK